MREISFGRNDFIIARKTVAVEKGDSIGFPDSYACKISCEGVERNYTGGEISEYFPKDKRDKKSPRYATVSLFRKAAVFEVPFKEQGKDTVILRIRIPNPEATEGLLNKIPNGNFFHDYTGGASYLFAHYDMEHRIRGLADHVHDRLYDQVMSGADEKALQKALKDEFGMELVSVQNTGEVNE